MFAPPFSLEAGSHQSHAPDRQKTKRWGLARRVKAPMASFFACLLTMSLAAAGHAQNVVITTDSTPITEGASGSTVNADFQVSLSSPATAPVEVTLSTSPGTAIAGQDFNPLNDVKVTFPTGTSGPTTVSVQVVGDDVYEPNNNRLETFSLVATAATGGATTNNSRATATIQDDDPIPLIEISDPAPIVEGNSGLQNYNFTVTLSGPSSQTTTVQYSAGADPEAGAFSATPGTDFQQTSGTLSITAGATEASFSVPIIGDVEDEGTETFLVTLSNPNGAQLGARTARGTITDNDGPAARITDVSLEEGNDFVFTVSLSAVSPESVSITYTTKNNTAIAPNDYTAQSGELVFPPGVTVLEITVPTIDDNLVEAPNEIFTVELSGASDRVTFADSQGVGTIQDNETPPVISISPVSKAEGDTGTTTFTFEAVLNKPSTQTVLVDYRVTPGNTSPATQGNDYINTSGTLRFTNGATRRSFDVEVIGDTIDENDERFNVILSNPQNGGFAGGTSTLTTTGTILNDDGPTISFVDSTIEINEGAAGARPVAVFTVRLNKISDHTVSVKYDTTPGTVNPATLGSDLDRATGTLNFRAGQQQLDIRVQIKGDVVDENDETFFVVLSNPTGGTLANPSTATGTIRDDDATPTVRVSDFTGNEGNGGSTTFPFVLTLDRPSAQTVTVDYATAGVTATDTLDFTTASNTVTFNPGVTKQTVNIRVIGDLLDEPTETFRLNLTNATNASLPATPFATGTIRDDDATPSLSISSSVSIQEDTDDGVDPDDVANLTFTVSLSAPSGQNVSGVFSTVTPNVNSGQLRPATAGSDYNGISGAAFTIPAGATFTEINVGIRADELDEYDEYFRAVISNPVNAIIKKSSGVGIILDDDEAGNVTIDAPSADNTAIEGVRNAVFPVELSDPAGRDIKIFYSITGDGQNDRATPLLDLAPLENGTGKVLLKQNSSFIIIRAGQTRGNIVISALADKLDEAEFENYRVTITRIDPSDWTVEDEADGTAVSTIEDRNPGFTSFARTDGKGGLDGNQSYNQANNNGTDVTLTGNQFIINNVSQVRRVLFSVISNNIAKAVASTDFEVENATTIRAKVPNGAVSGRIRIELTNGQILAPTGNNADRLFFVNAIPISFTPTSGVPRNTVVTIRGINLEDPNNPIVGVRFGADPADGTGGVASNTQTAGKNIEVRKSGAETIIRATVPTGADDGAIVLVTRNGTNYPPSLGRFNVDEATAGGIRFVETQTVGVLENATNFATGTGGNNSLPSYTLQLRPAVQGNAARTEIAPRGDVVVRVAIKDNLDDLGLAVERVRSPEISVRGGRAVRRNGQTFEITFPANTFQNAIIDVIDSGNDISRPDFFNFSSGEFYQSQVPRILTLTATIIRTGDQELYPTDTAPAEVTAQRFDIHGLETDIGAVFRTSEEQAITGATTSFKLNLRNINNAVDVDPNGKPIFVGNKYSAKPQVPVINPDGTVNRDAEPKFEVSLPFVVSAPDEALIRYYVRVPRAGGGFDTVYPDGAVFGPTTVIRYGLDPAVSEYFKYDHFIEVQGVDDDIRDGSQEYQINLDLSGNNQNRNSVDREYQNLNLQTPFTLINNDNEESTGPGQPGFIFESLTKAPTGEPQLTVDEAGAQDSFQVSLRKAPSAGGKVTLRLRTSNPAEVMLVDPTDPSRQKLVETLDLTFFADTNGTVPGKESRYDSPITVLVAGVDDLILDGDKTARILTSTVKSLTTDGGYQTIDPLDPIVTNQDNESIGVTVTPLSLFVDEGSTQDFEVRLNSRPTNDAFIQVQSLNTNVATVTIVNSAQNNRLTFTQANWTVPQIVRVRGVPDNAFTPERTTTIQLGNIQSADRTLNGLDVPDVAVTVQNQTQAFSIQPAAVLSNGLTTSEDGGIDTFTVQLPTQPTQTVQLILSVSSGEAVLSYAGQRGNSVTLTFTPSDFSNQKQVTVTGVDDSVADGTVAYNITGTTITNDPVYSGQSFPVITGVNLDNDGTSSGGTITYAANGTYHISFPFATTVDEAGTLTPAQAFSSQSGGTASQYTLYKFNVTKQRDSRAVNGGSDFVVVPASEKLVRGIGYRLITGSEAVVLNQPSNTLKPFNGTSFTLNLTWNPTFLDDTTSQTNLRNGYNFIGFPFDPAKFNRVAFPSSQVKYGNETYETVGDAAAAGIIDQQLYTVDAQGELTKATNDLNIRPYRAYFVRILRNDQPVRLILRNPSK